MKVGFYILSFVFASLLLFSNEVGGQSSTRRRQRNRNSPRRNEGLPIDLQEAYESAVDGHVSTPAPTNAASLPPDQADDVAGSESSRSEVAGSESSRSNPATNNIWAMYTPSTPDSTDVECYVEVVSVTLQGGRCTRLGGHHRPYICQSGPHFEFNQQCQQIIEARNAENPTPGK